MKLLMLIIAPPSSLVKKGGIRGRLMNSSEQLSLPGLDTPSPFNGKNKHGLKDLRKLYLLETKIASLEAENTRLRAALKQATTDLMPRLRSCRN